MIQIDMPMPESCLECPLMVSIRGKAEKRCRALNIIIGNSYDGTTFYDCRPKFCPLVEVEYRPVVDVFEDDVK